jgi:hypothetical protein
MRQPWPRDSNETASDQPGAVHQPIHGTGHVDVGEYRPDTDVCFHLRYRLACIARPRRRRILHVLNGPRRPRIRNSSSTTKTLMLIADENSERRKSFNKRRQFGAAELLHERRNVWRPAPAAGSYSIDSKAKSCGGGPDRAMEGRRNYADP